MSNGISSVSQTTTAPRLGLRPLRQLWARSAPWLESADDRLTAVLLVVLVGAWLSEGLRTLLGLPHAVVGAVDAAEALICVWLAIRLVRERRWWLLVAGGVYVAWILTGLIGSTASLGAVFNAAKVALLLPLFALLLASRGASESRARLVAITLGGLCAFEFVLTLGQDAVVRYATVDPDLVVGSFGANNNAVLGVLVLLVATVGIAGYLTRARHGTAALVAVSAFPLVSAWMVFKVATLAFPVVAIIVAATVYLLHMTTARRAAIAVAAALVSTGIVIGAYAAFQPGSFNTLTSSAGFDTYLSTGSASGTVPTFARLGRNELHEFANAEVVVSRLPGSRAPALRVVSLRKAPYGAWLIPGELTTLRVRPGQVYEFSAVAAGATLSGRGQTIRMQLEWVGTDRRVLSTTSGSGMTAWGPRSGARRLATVGEAPAGAAYAIPKLLVTNSPAARSSLYVAQMFFQHVSPGVLLGQRASLARLGAVELRALGNAEIVPFKLPDGRRVLRVVGLATGSYAAGMSTTHAPFIRVKTGHKYLFGAHAVSAGRRQTIELLVEWLGRRHAPVSVLRGRALSSRRHQGLRRLEVAGVAPAGAAYALPIIAVPSRAKARSSIYVTSLVFGHPSSTAFAGAAGTSHVLPRHHVVPRHRHHPVPRHRHHPVPRHRHHPVPRHRHHPVLTHHPAPQPLPAARPVQGHLTLLRMALHTVSGSALTELFGNGLGYATVAADLGAGPRGLSPDRSAASRSDFGQVLAERGWSGIAILALLALALIIFTVRAARSRALQRWSTAFTLAVPAAVLVMAGYGLIADDQGNRAAALTFWLIVAIGVSSVSHFRLGAPTGTADAAGRNEAAAASNPAPAAESRG